MDLVEIVRLEFELFEQEGCHRVGTVVGHLEAHGGAEMALRQLALQRLAQVLGFLLVDEEVGVAGDAELVAARHRHPGEQFADVGVQDRRQEDEAVIAAGDLRRHPDHPWQGARRLNHGSAGIAPEGVTPGQFDREVEALVEYPRERVRGIEADRRQHRHQFAEKVVADPCRLGLVPVGASQEVDALRGQVGNHLAVEDLVLPRDQSMRGVGYRAKLLLRGQAVGRKLRRSGADLLLEAGDPDLEELVHVAGDDGEEAQALEQRRRGVLGLGEDAALEGEDAEFAVDEGVGAGQIHVGGVGELRYDNCLIH